MKHKRLDKIAYTLYVTPFIITYLTIGHLIPYNWYVQNEKVEVTQACVGSNIISYYAERNPLWGMKGDTFAEVVKFEGNISLETVIKRNTHDKIGWAYEPGSFAVGYDTEWSHPFNKEGEYGINSWSTIYPLPFVSVTRFTPAEELRFTVVECD